MKAVKCILILFYCLTGNLSLQGSSLRHDKKYSYPENMDDSICFGVDFFAYRNRTMAALSIYEMAIPGTRVEVTPLSVVFNNGPHDTTDLLIKSRSDCARSHELAQEYIRRFYYLMYDRRYQWHSAEEDKVRLKRFLRVARGKYSPLPDFYKKEIDRKYKGNIDACVDNWFAHSIFTDSLTRQNFLKNPTYTKLKKDPAYLYTKSWMKCKAYALLTADLPVYSPPKPLPGKVASEDRWQLNMQKVAEFYRKEKLYEECWLMKTFLKTKGYKRSEKWAEAHNIKQDSMVFFSDWLGERYNEFVKSPSNWEESKQATRKELHDYATRNVPLTIFSFINKRFGGNIDAFVDYMYKCSIFAGPENFKLFDWAISAKQIREDPFFLYSLSRLQYQSANKDTIDSFIP